jgi:hypothetical protein
MNIKRKREAGKVLGRAGISAEIIKLCKIVAENENYKEAIEIAGRIKVLAESSTCDSYWCGKMNRGITRQEFEFDYMLKTIESGGSKKVWM